MHFDALLQCIVARLVAKSRVVEGARELAVDVIESTTLDAMRNCASRLVMPWRLAIPPKSV
jgi:hypothetical protein